MVDWLNILKSVGPWTALALFIAWFLVYKWWPHWKSQQEIKSKQQAIREADSNRLLERFTGIVESHTSAFQQISQSMEEMRRENREFHGMGVIPLKVNRRKRT